MPKSKSKRPECPGHLNDLAREEFGRICDELDEQGTLSTADRAVIALYAQAWARWVKAETKIAEKNEIVEAPKTKVPMHNLWLPIANTAHQQVTRLAFELGLSPNSRSKIKAGNKADADEGPLEF